MIIKFNESLLPSQEIIDLIQLRQVTMAPSVLGWYVTDPVIGDIIVQEDDYFLIYNGTFKIILRTDYLVNTQLRRIVTQEVAIQLLEDIIQGFVDSAATDLVKLDILNTINAVMVMIIGNKINAAQVIATAIPTTTNFTTARKNGLIALINAAILQL